MKAVAFCALLFLIRICSFAQNSPSPADSIIHFSCAKAAKEDKRVLIIFSASWCVWCHRLDSSLNDYRVRDFFHRNFVVSHLTVLESGVQKMNENPGAQELYRKYTGQNDASLPFWIVLDKYGNLLADSKTKSGMNTGCPATFEEVKYFVEVLKQTSDMNPKEQEDIELVFRRNDQ